MRVILHGQCGENVGENPDECPCLIKYYVVRWGSQTTTNDEGMSAIGCCFKCNRVILKDRQGVSVCDIDNCGLSFTPSHVINMTM